MTRKTAYLLLAVAAAGLLLVTACSSAKKTGKGEPYHPADATPEEHRNTVEGEFVALAKSYTAWSDVSMPLKVQVAQPKRLNVSASAKMVRGKALSISLRVFGLEVGSLYADNDSVIIVSKFNNMYCSESLSYLKDTYGLTLADMQAMLLGQVFTPGSGILAPDDIKQYKVVLGENSIGLTPKKLPKGLAWTFAAVLSSETAPSLRTLTVTADGHEPVVAAYGTAQATGAGMAAPWVNLSTNLRQHHVDATLTWDFNRAKWNSGLTIAKPKIPSGARLIPLAKVFEMLKK